jgi:WD40 repeat protein
MRSARLLMASLLFAGSFCTAADRKARPSICFLGFTTKGRQILTFDSSDEGLLWDVDTGKPRPLRKQDEKRIEGMWLASVGRREPLCSSSYDDGPFRFGIVPMNREFELHETPRLIACSTDGKRLLVARRKDQRCKIMVRDRQSGKTLWEREQPQDRVSASLSPDGRTLALAADDPLIFVDLDSSRERRYPFAALKFEASFRVDPLKFSPDGSRIACVDGTGKALVMSVREGRLLRAIPYDLAIGLAFSADGRTLCIDEGEIIPRQSLWEVATGQRIRSYEALSCLFSPDNRLITTSNEKTLRLYDLYSGKIFRTCKDVVGFPGTFSFSQDGKRFVSASQDSTILLWDIATPETVERTTPLDEKALERLWNELETGKASAAYEAMGWLLGDPRHTLPFLHKRLRPVPPVEEKRLQQWIADLDSDSFDKRETASRELGRLGSLAESALRKALAGPTSFEMRRRMKELLRPFESKEMQLSPEELAHVRAIQVLERIGTSEARRLLKHLAEGAEGVLRTREAQEALHRMRQHGE